MGDAVLVLMVVSWWCRDGKSSDDLVVQSW